MTMSFREIEGRGWGPDSSVQERALEGYSARVARRIEAARESRGLSLRDAARITDGISVSSSTIRNYGADTVPYTTLRLGVVQALSMALCYDLRAMLCMPPYDSDDDAADLERASLEPTLAGVYFPEGKEAPDGCEVWEIYEHHRSLSLIVVKEPSAPKVGKGDRRYLIDGDASKALETLAYMYVFDQGFLGPNYPDSVTSEIARKAGDLKLQVTSQGHSHTDAQDTISTTPLTLGHTRLHRRRSAAERAVISLLGDGWSFRESDGERCPFLTVDETHDVEIRGWSMDGGATCEVSLWYIPDPLDQDYADEIGSVRYVPCDTSAISKCVGYLVDSCDDSQAHSFAYWDLPR